MWFLLKLSLLILEVNLYIDVSAACHLVTVLGVCGVIHTNVSIIRKLRLLLIIHYFKAFDTMLLTAESVISQVITLLCLI